MNRLPSNARVTTDDLLVKRWEIPGVGLWSQGKRVGRDCPLTAAERAEYVRSGAVGAVRYIRDTRSCSLDEALRLLNVARGGSPLTRRGG